MNTSLAYKLRELRKAKNVSQEKLAEYLNVSFQAVSKWENGITSPDIMLLPNIACYYGVTVDELLQVEKIDEKSYFEKCCLKSDELFRNGKKEAIISIWLEAQQKMPNSVGVKEHLMSIYFDIDKVKYQNEIIELGTEIYNTSSGENCDSYYKGQAINLIARTYAENGNQEKAKEWARKAQQINHSQELLYMQILDDEEWLTDTFRFANHWYLDQLFYMTARINMCNVKHYGNDYVQKVNKVVAAIFETIYPNDDMSFEFLQHLCTLHRCIAEDENSLEKNENVVKKHLTRAVECAIKSATVKNHELTHPLVYGWKIVDAPSDNTQIVRILKNELIRECFSAYQNKEWFIALLGRLKEGLQ